MKCELYCVFENPVLISLVVTEYWKGLDLWDDFPLVTSLVIEWRLHWPQDLGPRV